MKFESVNSKKLQAFMTTGQVNIQIGDVKINGVFVNGRIVSGTWVENAHYTFSGNFDENENLHGVGYMCYDHQRYEGVFEHGIFRTGKEFSGNTLRSEGKFEHTANSLPCLIEGTKYYPDVRYVGTFNTDYTGFKNGTATYVNGTVQSGMWRNNILQSGTVTNEKLEFSAKYTITRNRELNRDLLATCQVEFRGDPTTLPKELLVLYACRGNNCTSLHSIYTGELEKMQGNGVGYLLKFADQIRTSVHAFELPAYDELITNLTTPASMDSSLEVQSSNLEMFGTYYSSHD